jgi:hypothetical protein
MKISLEGSKLFYADIHTDGQTNATKLIAAFRNFSNVPKIKGSFWSTHHLYGPHIVFLKRTVFVNTAGYWLLESRFSESGLETWLIGRITLHVYEDCCSLARDAV